MKDQIENSKSEARMAAVKALYANGVNQAAVANVEPADPDEVVLDIISCYEDNEEGLGDIKIDKKFLAKLVRGVLENSDVLDKSISTHLNEKWRLERINPVLKAILQAGVYEIMEFERVPLKVIITEYVYISRSFFDEKEVGFVNGILDKIAHEVRDGK